MSPGFQKKGRVMENPIIMYGADWCPDCKRAKSFLNEHNIDFDFIDIEVDEKHARTVEKINEGKRIIPTFRILGKSYTNPDNRTLSKIIGINPGFRVILYGADWCPDCKRAKSFLDSHGIFYQYISIDEHEWAALVVEKINKGKRIIPTLVINGKAHTNPDNASLIELLNLKQEKTDKVYDCIVIGAGASGLTTALYLQREKFSTLILEKKNIGGNTYITQKIENYPGFQSVSGPELMDKMAEQVRAVGAEIKEGYEVQEIRKEDGVFHLDTNLGTFRAKSLVAAVGSTYRTLGIPGESDFIGAGVHFCATCDGPFYKGRDVVVIGGGNSAVEEGIYLSEICNHVHIIHNAEKFTATEAVVTKLGERSNITVHANHASLEFLGNESGQFSGVKIKDNQSGKEEVINADGAFIFIGLTPNTRFLKKKIELDEKGFIVTKCGSVQTSVDGFFAAGDARKGAIAQVASATGEGVIASFGVKEYLRS